MVEKVECICYVADIERMTEVLELWDKYDGDILMRLNSDLFLVALSPEGYCGCIHRTIGSPLAVDPLFSSFGRNRRVRFG